MKPNLDFTVKVKNRMWDVIIANVKGLTTYGKTIFIDNKHSGKDFLNTCIHECTHANFPYLQEGDVKKIADSITDVVWAAGFRNIYEKRRKK